MLVGFGERRFHALLALADAVLPGIVRAVGEPQAEDCAARLLHDLAAFDQVGKRFFAHAGAGVGDAAELVLARPETSWG